MPYPRTQNFFWPGLNLLSSDVANNPHKSSWTALQLAPAKWCPSSPPKHIRGSSPRLPPHPVFVQLALPPWITSVPLWHLAKNYPPPEHLVHKQALLWCYHICKSSFRPSKSVAACLKYGHSSSHIPPCMNSVNIHLSSPITVLRDVCVCTHMHVELNLKRPTEFIIYGSPANMKLSQQEDHVISPCDNLFY